MQRLEVRFRGGAESIRPAGSAHPVYSPLAVALVNHVAPAASEAKPGKCFASIAPSGMAFYRGDAFPQWQGDLLVVSLTGDAQISKGDQTISFGALAPKTLAQSPVAISATASSGKPSPLRSPSATSTR